MWYDYFFSILFAMLASFTLTLGKVMMKLGHIRQDKIMSIHQYQQPSSTFSDLSSTESFNTSQQLPWKFGAACAWWIGLLNILILNTGFALLSYGFGSATLTAPFFGLPMAWYVFLSYWLLRESPSHKDIIGSVIVCLGCFIVTISANRSDPPYQYPELLGLYKKDAFIIYILIVCVWLFLLLLLGTLGGSRSRFALTAISGTIGGQQFLFKSVAEIFKIGGIEGDNIWKDWQSYAIIFSSIAITGTSITILYYALRLYDSLDIVPRYCSCVCLLGTISGLIHFEEWNRMVLWQLAAYPSGVFLILFGINYVAYYRKRAKEPHFVTLTNPSMSPIVRSPHATEDMRDSIGTIGTILSGKSSFAEEMVDLPETTMMQMHPSYNMPTRPPANSTAVAIRDAPARMAERLLERNGTNRNTYQSNSPPNSMSMDSVCCSPQVSDIKIHPMKNINYRSKKGLTLGYKMDNDLEQSLLERPRIADRASFRA